MIRCLYIPCLFDKNTWIEFDSKNQTAVAVLIELLRKNPGIRQDSPYFTVRLNGKVLSPFQWHNPLKDGDRITAVQETGGYVIGAIAAILGTSISWLGGITVGTLLSVVMVVASVAYSIYSYLSQPSVHKHRVYDDPNYGWDGASMQSNPGVPVPIIYGRHVVSGSLVEGR